jgi:predicted ATPase
MIDTLTLKNFKGFSDLDRLRMKPITILCGTNSCGKSSILQSLLLLKQTLESQNPNQTLLLNGRFTHLGAFDNIVFQKNPENRVTLDLRLSLTERDAWNSGGRHSPPIYYFFRQLFPDILKGAGHGGTFQVELRFVLESPKAKYIFSDVRQTLVDEFHCTIEWSRPDGEVIPGGHFSFVLDPAGYYLGKWENVKLAFLNPGGSSAVSSGEQKMKIQFGNLFPISITDVDAPKEKAQPPPVIYLAYQMRDVAQAVFSCITYLGPLREEPSRRYIYEDEVLEIGIKGENAAYIFTSEQDNVLFDHFLYDSKEDTFKSVSSIKVSDAVAHWLDLMNIKGFKPEPINEIIYLNLNSGASEKTRVNIADVGFGVSQIFPIILEGIRMKKGNTLLLEQPEIHLHPNLQMQMADYFISLALSGRKVILETHSDHIVNRLVRRIVEDQNHSLADLIGIYFIRMTEHGAEYEEVIIDEMKGITNWPQDFFDQTATEQERILKAGLEKRRKQRESQ